jgi:hypothetical protein
MVLGEIENVRAIAGWPSDEEVPDGEVTDALMAATRKVVTITGVEESDWTVPPSDINLPLAEETAEVCAASLVVLRVSGTEKIVERAKMLGELCNSKMQILNQAVASTVTDNPSFIDVNSAYTTYPLNESVDPYDPLLSES